MNNKPCSINVKVVTAPIAREDVDDYMGGDVLAAVRDWLDALTDERGVVNNLGTYAVQVDQQCFNYPTHEQAEVAFLTFKNNPQLIERLMELPYHTYAYVCDEPNLVFFLIEFGTTLYAFVNGKEIAGYAWEVEL